MSNPLFAFRRDEDFNFGGAARGLPPGVHLEFYGGGKGGSSTQSVSVPPEVLARYNAVNARAENVAQTPFTPYSSSPEAFVAPLSSSQQAGIGNINALQGSANQAVQQGQNLQGQGIDTARTGQGQANAIDQAALQGISQAQQQGTAYNQAAGQNIGQAMSSASPYMQQMAGLTQAGLGQGQQYLGGATGLTQQAIQMGQQYANQAQPYYTGALQAAQPLNQQAQQYMQAGAQGIAPQALDYSQYMNPYMNNVVQAQQALQAQENAQQRSALQGKAIQSGAFGGDRAGIEQANLARQQSLANQATMANLLQSGYGQAQAAAQQQQGVGLGAAQANRAAQQAAAQQAAAFGQQQYAQNLGLGQGLAALGQQQYGQALGTGAQIGQLGQQGYAQNLGAGAQLGQVGQQLYAQNIGQGQAIQGLGNQQFTQGLQGSQAAAGIGQNIFGNAAQTAGITQAGGMNTANLGLQNQAAQIAAAQAQMAAGQQQQQTDQAGKTALYNQFLQQQGYPFQVGQYLANIAEGTGALSGSTTTAARTGQRGGRMGDGYASGGLIPDSQGGAVYEPGAYYRGGLNTGGRTGFAAGGWSQDPESGNWSNGAEEPTTMSNADYQQMLERQNTGDTTPATPAVDPSKPIDPKDYSKIINQAYGQIGRTGIGTGANNIDQAGYDYWTKQLQSGAMTPDQFNAQFTANAKAYNAANPTSDVAKLTQPAIQSNADWQNVSGLNKDIATAFKDATGKDVDPASARKYQDMLNAGMSMDQIKYNIGHSAPALLKSGDVDALKGTPLTYNAGNFSRPVAPVQNQYGAYSAGDFTPAGVGYGQQQGYGQRQGYGPQGYGQPQGYGNMSAMQGGYGGYGGGLGGYGGSMMGGYGQPSNYGMPNFGSSPQYGGAPDYAGAMQYGGMQSQYGMPQFGRQQNYYPPQATPQATGKGPAPVSQQAMPAPTATGKGASTPPPTTGKGPSTGGTATGFNAGGRVGRADGGRAGYAGGGDPSSVLRGLAGQYDPGDPQGLVARQAAMFAGAPGAGAAGYVPPSQGGAGQYKMLQPQANILPQQQSGIKEAIGMGTSIASLGEAGSKLYSKLSGPKTTGAQDIQAFFNKGDAASQAAKDISGGLNVPDQSTGLGGFFGNIFGSGNAAGGRIGYAAGGIPGLANLKQGYADIPGGTGEDTPMGDVIKQGTQTPTELANEMKGMSSGAGGTGGSGGGGLSGTIGTAASLASLGNLAFKAGSWMMGLPIFAAGGRVGKAGGGALVDPSNPQDQAMAKSFDNLLQRYDNNPLLAAAAMDVGTKVVDAAIQKAQQTGGDITDFLPRRTQEYMFALSKAAMGAHEAINRPARATGGRTGYATRGSTDDAPAGLAPAPSDAMTMDDVAGGLSPEPTVQVAELKNPDILRALRGSEGANGNPEAKNPNSTAGGLYQYLDSTWQKQAPLAGVDIKQYPTARSAPAEIQHQVADANVSSILEQNKGNVQAVPHLWYSGNPEGKLSPEGLAANKGFTQEQYNQRFFNKLGAGAPEQKPVQVATATGLAPKSDAGPFETIGKKILPDAVPTDSSFWVPLIAGLGSMLASDKYRFSQRLGEGLVGGAAAYGKQQEFQQKNEQQAQQIAQNAALMGLKGKEFGLKEQEFSLTQRTQAIQIMQQLQKINLGRQMAGQPELSAEDYFKQVGASDLLPAAKAPDAAPAAAPTVTPPAPAGGLNPPASAAPAINGAATGTPAVGLQPPAAATTGISATPHTIAASTPGMPSIRDPFWATVDRSDSLPTMERNWNLAMAVGDTATANTIMQRMDTIKKTGEVMVNGEVTHIPGYLAAQAAAAAAKETATKQAGLPFIERIGPGGEKYIPALADQAKGTTPNIPPASTEAGKVEPAGAAPQKAVIDQKTGQVNGSIPAPPPGGGYPLSKQPGATGMTQAAQRLAKNDEQFEKDFMEKTPTMDAAIERLDQMTNSFKMIHSGAMEDKLKGYAALAASYGDQKLAARIMGGQVGAVAAAQLIDKNKVNLVLDTLKAATPRFAQSEFLKLSDVGSPDIAIEPQANHGMISTNKGTMEWSRQFTRDWEKAKDAGWQSPSAFFTEWSQLNPLSTFQESARRRMGTFGGMDLPPINEWTEGAVYHVPKGLKGPQAEQMGRAGLKGGDTFRFLGDKIERVKPSDLFKYGQ